MVNNLNIIKNKFIHLIGWILIILIIIISFNYASYFELNNFEHTIVDGNNFYTDDFIISSLPYNPGCSIFDISPNTIQNKILRLIKDESSKDIMSDKYIVFKLKKNGINIARRTVSKYRNLMNIPSSFKRKNQASRYF